MERVYNPKRFHGMSVKADKGNINLFSSGKMVSGGVGKVGWGPRGPA